MLWGAVVILGGVAFVLLVVWAAVSALGFKSWVRRMGAVPDDLRRADDGKQDPWPPAFGMWVDPPQR